MSLPSFYSKLIEYNSDKSQHKMDIGFIKLWNRSFLMLSLLFFAISVYDFFWISSVICYSFFLLSVVFFYSLFTDLKFNKLAQTFLYLFLSFVYFYTSSLTGLGSGVSLYYIPLVLSIPFFLSFKEDKGSIVLICFFILFELFLNFKANILEHPFKEAIFRESLFGSLALLVWVVYFVIEKQLLLIKYYRSRTAMQIEEMDIDVEKLNEVVELAAKGSCLFLQKFKILYPYFCDRLLEIQPNIVTSELEFCAYLKLNFSTKEIAKFTNSSVRAIEGRKYRVRKKCNIPEKTDIYMWIANLR